MRCFLDWITAQGYADTPTLPKVSKVGPLRSYKRTYGKVQGKRPARRLNRTQAFDQLVGTCNDGTVKGLRDATAVRLGLAGLRIGEIVRLTVADCANLPDLRWTGKGNVPRRITAGQALSDCLASLIAVLPDQHPESRLMRPMATGFGTGFSRTRRTCSTLTIRNAIAQRAEAAGLGHVAPHDLRRTAASILHNAKTTEGGHLFDLLDIQRVLGHADPATTMKCYIEQDASETLDRAATVLD